VSAALPTKRCSCLLKTLEKRLRGAACLSARKKKTLLVVVSSKKEKESKIEDKDLIVVVQHARCKVG
jgi:hypothetical protein